MNVQSVRHILRTFITYLLVHMHQKKKIALEIAAKITSVNGLYVSSDWPELTAEYGNHASNTYCKTVIC